MLFQETRELYVLQHFIIGKIIDKNREILILNDKLEDFRAALESESNMKIFMN